MKTHHILTFLGLLLSVGGILLFGEHILAYPDAQSHLLIARRVCDSSSPGLAQLGAVWLPLTHILSLPLVCADVWSTTWWGNLIVIMVVCIAIVSVKNTSALSQNVLKVITAVAVAITGLTLMFLLRSNFLYTSGIGMSIFSMLAYVLTGLFLFQLVKELTGNVGSGVVAWMVFMLNPNVLYLQSTAMTEVPLYFGVVSSLYTFWRLSKEPSNFRWLFLNGASALVMTTVRYEGWVILMAEAAIYGVILLLKRHKISIVIGHLVQWGYLALAGIVGWILWNAAIFGNPLEFQTGSYAKPSNWVSGGEAGVGNLRLAFETYIWGMWDTIGPVILLGVVALVVYMVSTRCRKEALGPLIPLIMIPFFGFMIYRGQRPMQSWEIEGTIYNARFALIIILPCAIFTGYIARNILLRVVTALVIGGTALSLSQGPLGVITLTEARISADSSFTQSQVEVANFLHANYRGESMLMESYGNEQVQFVSQINLHSVIYEGTYRLWEPILNAPYANNIHWIVMRGGEGNIPSLQPDLVWTTVRSQQSFWDHYELVFQNEVYSIYRLKSKGR